MSTNKTVLKVAGMTCHSCTRHVATALRGVDGVAHVEVSLREGLAIVETSSEAPPIDALVTAVAEAGYEATPERDEA